MRLVVVGNGMVGHRLVSAVRDRSSSVHITVLAEETRPAYDRVRLSAWFEGEALDLPPVSDVPGLGSAKPGRLHDWRTGFDRYFRRRGRRAKEPHLGGPFLVT